MEIIKCLIITIIEKDPESYTNGSNSAPHVSMIKGLLTVHPKAAMNPQ